MEGMDSQVDIHTEQVVSDDECIPSPAGTFNDILFKSGRGLSHFLFVVICFLKCCLILLLKAPILPALNRSNAAVDAINYSFFLLHAKCVKYKGLFFVLFFLNIKMTSPII